MQFVLLDTSRVFREFYLFFVLLACALMFFEYTVMSFIALLSCLCINKTNV